MTDGNLHVSAPRQRELIDVVLESVWIHVDGHIVFANLPAARIFGFERAEDLIGRSAIDWVHPDDRARAIARTRSMLEEQRPAPMTELRFLAPHGRELVMEVRAAPITFEGRPAILAAALDITERRAAESQLRQAQKMEAVGQLTGGIAHDFNNLLAVVIGNLDMLESRIEGDADAKRFAQDALSASLRGAELTRKLLAFSRVQPLQATTLDVNELLQGMAELLRRTLGERIEMTMSLADDLWPVHADAAQIESAVLNLAVNARDAMPDGGRLTVESRNERLDEQYVVEHPEARPGDYVMIVVTDTGTGIASEHLARVFEPFFTTKEVGKGSGLGLSMVYGFAKQSGGHVGVYSELGAGTAFRIHLPRSGVAPSAAEAAARPGTPATEVKGNGELVLVVDDNPHVRRMVVEQLRQLGYGTAAAASGAEALDILRATPGVGLLFTDVVMPGGMSGWELGAAARALRPGLPILYTSGFTEAAVRGSRPTVGVSETLLTKPYRKSELARKIKEMLGGA